MTAFPDLTTSAQPGRPAEATTTSTRVDWAPVPRVDLLPAEIVDGRRLARLK